MKIILTRHTVTDWNLEKRKQGQTDIPLNSRGKIEAVELAKALLNFDISSIISSDLKRSSETAQIINNLLVVPLSLDSRLRECSFGKLEGLTKLEVADKYGSRIEAYWENNYKDYDFRDFGGENRADVFNRHILVLESLIKNKTNNSVLLVGHGRGMNTLLFGLGYPSDLRQGEYRVIEYNT